MPITLYSYKFGREVPLLTDEEYRPIAQMLMYRIEKIKAYVHRVWLYVAAGRSRRAGAIL